MRDLVARIVVIAAPVLAIMIKEGYKWGPY